jgi:hypothetical protein
MNLERHLRVIWRYRVVVAIGLLLGSVLAFMASFQVSNGLQRRGSELWTSSSLVLVTQQGFPWGRVTLPGSATDSNGASTATPGATGQTEAPERQQFADPGRFNNLALLYSVISYSDQVRARLPERPEAGQIQAIPLDPTGSGQAELPIISLTTKAATPEAAMKLNEHAYAGLRDLLKNEQQANDIPAKERVVLAQLNHAQKPVLEQGRSWTSSILAYMLCVIAALALAHILEGLRIARERRERTAPAVVESDILVPVMAGGATNGHGPVGHHMDDDVDLLGPEPEEPAGRQTNWLQ